MYIFSIILYMILANLWKLAPIILGHSAESSSDTWLVWRMYAAICKSVKCVSVCVRESQGEGHSQREEEMDLMLVHTMR